MPKNVGTKENIFIVLADSIDFWLKV